MSSRVYLLFPPRGHEQNKTTYYEVEYTVVLVFNIDEWLTYEGARAICQSIPYSYLLLIFYCTNNIIFYHYLGGDEWLICVFCVFFPSILDIKFVGRTSRGHTGGRSHRIFNPPSFCGACLDFCREKDSAIPFPRRP